MFTSLGVKRVVLKKGQLLVIVPSSVSRVVVLETLRVSGGFLVYPYFLIHEISLI